MAQVAIEVNGKRYVLGCADGEEDHLRKLAAVVDSRVNSLKGKIGAMDEARMLLMAAMLLADEQDLGSAEPDTSPTDDAAAALNAAADDIENIAEILTSA